MLVDGSDQRALGQLVGEPYSRAKLTQPQALSPTIPDDHWRHPLQRGLADAEIEIETPAEQLEHILDLAAGRPYPMMCAARCVAFRARQLGERVVLVSR